MKMVYRKHKKLAVFAFIAILSIFLLYFISIVVWAWLKIPEIVSEATAQDKIRLRLEDVPDEYQNILLTVEDPNFYSHHGVDFSTPGAGWTTITQGIVKVYFYNGFTPGFLRHRKVEQSITAWVFDLRVDKRTQLLIFVNSAYLGNHDGRDIVGFEDASNTYFNTRFSNLTKDQFLSLVAMLIGPNEFHVVSHPDRNQERVKRIISLLNGRCTPSGLSDVYYRSCH